MNGIITQTIEKIKAFWEEYFEEAGVSLIIVLVAVSSFYLGRSSAVIGAGHLPIVIEEPGVAKAATASTTGSVKGVSTEAKPSEGGVVATKNGKRWYLPWCPSVAKLAESAKRHFATVAAAEAAGLTPAKNCAGMK